MADLPPLSSGWRLDRQIPLALIAALCLQSGAALLWAGGAAERITELEQRVDHQSGVAERLARLEAQSAATQASLQRIEAKLDVEEAHR